MTYETFKSAYTQAFKKLMSYGPDEIGSVLYAGKMGELAEAYPEYAARAEEEV